MGFRSSSVRTLCSSAATFDARADRYVPWRWATAATIAYDNSNGVVGRSRPSAILPRTRVVSRVADSIETPLPIGPCEVTR
jgi:hypothetical protein